MISSKKYLFFLSVVVLSGHCSTNSQQPVALSADASKETMLGVLKAKLSHALQEKEQLRQEFNYLLDTTTTLRYTHLSEYFFVECVYPMKTDLSKERSPKEYSKEQTAACSEFKKTYDAVSDYSHFKGGPKKRKAQGSAVNCLLKQLAPEDKMRCDAYVKALQQAAVAFGYENDFDPLPSPKLPSTDKIAWDASP